MHNQPLSKNKIRHSLRDPKTFKILLLAYSTLMLLGLSDNIRGPLYPEILEQFALTNTQGSFFFSMSSVFGFLGGFFSHRIIQKMGSLRALRMTILLLGFSQLAMSAAPSFAFLLLGVFFFGFSLGLMGVIQNMMVVQEIPMGPLKNRVLSGLHSMYAASSVMAPILVNFVVWLSFPATLWRLCFIAGSSFCGLVFVLSFRGPDLSEKLEMPKARVEPETDRGAQIFFAVSLACYVLAEILVSSRMALFMRREYQSDLSESSWYTAGFFVCLLLSRLLFTLWTPGLKIKTQLQASLTLTLLSLLLGIYVHPVGLAISGFCMGPFYPLMMVQLGQLFHGRISQALSWAVSLSSLFVVLMHVFVGFVTDAWGLRTAFLLGPAFCILGMIMIGSYEKIFRRLQHSF
jgi:MFS transporter, FHS family, glucose/mannose:H+ symporter